MTGNRTAGSDFFAFCFNCSNFSFSIGVETVDADYRSDTGFLDGFDVGDNVTATFKNQINILFCVLFSQRTTGNNFGAAAMHLEGADGGNDNRTVRNQAGEAAF